MDDARHATGHGTLRSGADIVEGVRRPSKAFEGVSGALKGFGVLRRGIGCFAGVRVGRGRRVESNGSGGGRGSPLTSPKGTYESLHVVLMYIYMNK